MEFHKSAFQEVFSVIHIIYDRVSCMWVHLVHVYTCIYILIYIIY